MNAKVRVVCATRETAENFPVKTALGRSLALYGTLFELRLFPSNSRGLPHAYNADISESESDLAILVFVHDDLHLLDFHWPARIAQGLSKFDVIGVAGNRRRVPGQPAWRFLDDRFTRDQRENLSGVVALGRGGPADRVNGYGVPGHEVKLLDGVLLAARSETLRSKQVLLDEAFDLHFCDLDLCRTAEIRGLRMGTWAIDVMHESDGAFGTAGWRQGYQRYIAKWQF
jgi:hypothetical protein